MEPDIGIKRAKFNLSNRPGEIISIRNVSINTISEINDFVISLNEVDKMYNYSKIDKILVELFKKAKLFEICIEHLKRA